jgi:PLP dependent protein
MLTSPHFSAGNSSNALVRNLRESFEETRTRIASAAMRCGREPGSIGLVAVSKTQPAERIRALAECGQRDFGENYLQEALSKIADLEDLALTWHFIGQLQANKTRAVAERFHWVHTLDRERIALRLNDQRPHYAPPLNICIQVRLADEPGKGGATPEETAALARCVRELPRLTLRGLMCIPPPRTTFEEQHALFAQLADLQLDLIAQGCNLDTLSMGMSADLEAAIAAGATWVRIGTAIFGERPTQ